MLESLRKALIRWNVAPLFLVGVMVYAMLNMLHFYQTNACELAEWHVGGIFTFIGAIAGLIYKMYNSMQKDRSDDDVD